MYSKVQETRLFSINQTSPSLLPLALRQGGAAQDSSDLRRGAVHPLPTPKAPAEGRRWRIALYSHDTMGLGHKRRNQLIAQAIGTSALNADVLMLSGMRDASDGPMPAGVDYLTLPALYKSADGQYQPRHLSLGLAELIGLRSQLIRTAIKSFQPDVLIIDNVPRGAMRELDPTLEYVKSQPHIRCVLGLRDILDTPSAMQRDWQQADNDTALRHYYDAIWVYGDPAVYDLRHEAHLPPDITAKMRPLGYLDQRQRLRHLTPTHGASLEPLPFSAENLVLCLVGGGQDGADLAAAFAQATFPAGTIGVLLTGPFMPPDRHAQLRQWSATNPQLHIVDYLSEPTRLLERAHRVVAMGGYNTICEILSFQKNALIVPRLRPRQEQWLRAKRLQQMGWVDVLHPQHLTPATLSHWLQQPIAPTPPRPRLNLNGLDNVLVELQHLLQTAPLATSQAS